MSTDMTLGKLAGEAYGCFEARKRLDGESYVALRDDAPEWLSGLVRAAHGDMLPDDWRYDAIHSALGFLHDTDPDSEDEAWDLSGEFADSNVDVYTGPRLAWLASNLQRAGYCDSAAAEFGADDDASITEQVGLGQYAESSEVFGEVLRGLVERLELLEDEGVEA
jgi:hypothetical protein